MIEKWTRKDASTFEKQIIGAATANNIVVNNPRIASGPVSLDSVLGSYKENIDHLYGIAKWNSRHGGGGSGGSGGGEAAETRIMFTDSNNLDISDSSRRTDDSMYSFNVTIANADPDYQYRVTVYRQDKPSKVYRTAVLTRAVPTISITADDIVSGNNVIIASAQIINDGTRLTSRSLTVQRAGISISAVTVNYTSSSLEDGYTVTPGAAVYKSRDQIPFIVNILINPSISGNLDYEIDLSSILGSAHENARISVTGIRSTGQPITIPLNLSDQLYSRVMVNGKSYDIKVTSRLQIDGTLDYISAPAFTFRVSWVTADGITVLYSNPEWNDLATEAYSDSWFADGNNISMNGYVYAQRTYSYIYPIYYVYRRTADGGWDLIQNTGVINYGSEYDDGWTYSGGQMTNRDVNAFISNNIQRRQRNNGEGVSFDVNLSYNSMQDDWFMSREVFNPGYELEDPTDFAAIRVDVYIFAGNSANNITTMPEVDAEGRFVPNISVKSAVEYAAAAVPDYVHGQCYKNTVNGKAEGAIHSEEHRRFNLDLLSNLTGSYTQTEYRNPQRFEANGQDYEYDLPFRYIRSNNTTTGFVREDSKGVMKFRATGEFYGYMTPQDLTPFVLTADDGISSWTNLFAGDGSGFTIELVFNSDWHPNNKGTVFSMGTYNANGELMSGIEVALDKVMVKLKQDDNISLEVPLIQNTLTQIDICVSRRRVTVGGQTEDYIIANVYKNGISHALGAAAVRSLNDLMQFNGLYFGAKNVNGTMTNFTDADLYGLRLYDQPLLDYDVTRNWLITYSCMHKVKSVTGNSWEYDPDIVTAILEKNYFNADWDTPIWDFANKKAASGEALLEALTTVKQRLSTTSKEYYRELPVLLITTQDQGAYNYVSAIYDENAAAVNNARNYDSQPGSGTGLIPASMQYWDELGNDPVSITSMFFNIQGTSTQGYHSKNFEIFFGRYRETGSGHAYDPDQNYSGSLGDALAFNDGEVLFTPKSKKWLPENRFTLKADVMDSGHANNAAIGRWINDTGYMPKNPAQNDTGNKYRDKVKGTLEGFPVAVFVTWGDTTVPSFLGIYSFNLGRGSFFNLGFKQLERYELVHDNVGDAVDWKDAADSDYEGPSIVNRYEMKIPSDTVFSFECTTNDPVEATGLNQISDAVIQNSWDVKYKSDNMTDQNAFAVLRGFHEFLAFANDNVGNDNRNEQKYWYTVNSQTNEILTDKVYRSVSDPSVWFRNSVTVTELDAVDGQRRFSHIISAADIETLNTLVVKGQGSIVDDLCIDDMKWTEGLFLNKNTNRLSWNEFMNSRPDHRLGFYNADATDLYFNLSEKTVTPSTPAGEGGWMDFASFSCYFNVAMLFGMVDSLGKNFTLRTWNGVNGVATMFPAFYDMDTALGLNNYGAENINPIAFVDYWMNVERNGNTQIKVLTEHYPTRVNEGYAYNWYDPDDGTLLRSFTDSALQPPSPELVQYDQPQSHLWHLVRFLPYIEGNDFFYNNNGLISVYGEWGRLRGTKSGGDFSYFGSYKEFIENYYKAQNEAVGEMIFNLDYAEKYQTPVIRNNKQSFGDMTFCHGPRIEFVTEWLRKRISFLDSIYNLNGLFQMDDGVTVDSRFNELHGTNISGTTNQYDIFNATYSGNVAETGESPYLENFNGRTGIIKQNSRYYFDITANSPCIMTMTLGNVANRFLLMDNVPTSVNITAASSISMTVNFNAVSALSEWTGLKEIGLQSFNSVVNDWNLISLDFSGLESIQSDTNFNISAMNELRTLDLSNFKLQGGAAVSGINCADMEKLEELDIKGSSIRSLTFPAGGNLRTLDVAGTDLTELVLQDKYMLTGSKDGYLNLAGCTQLRTLRVINCPNLRGINFGSNISLQTVEIEDCDMLEMFNWDGESSTAVTLDNKTNVYPGVIQSIKITGSCPNLKSVSVRNVTNPDAVIDLSGCTGMDSLTIEMCQDLKTVPILPATISVGSDNKPTDYLIYDADYRRNRPFSLFLRNVAFTAFAFGQTDQSFTSYTVPEGAVDASYPYVSYVPYADADTVAKQTQQDLIMNLAVFKSLGTITLTNLTNLKFVALPMTATAQRINTQTGAGISITACPMLRRIFGNMSFAAGTFGMTKNLTSFRICDWNGFDSSYVAAGEYVSMHNSHKQVKDAFDSIMVSGSSLDVGAIVAKMHDQDPAAAILQDIRPWTRLAVDTELVRGFQGQLSQAFNNTAVSMNDVYYIMAIVNIYNRNLMYQGMETPGLITNLSDMFNGCPNIFTEYSQDAARGDRSPSHMLFKYLASVNSTPTDADHGGGSGLLNIFNGTFMSGVLYSPDWKHTYTDPAEFGDHIGILTPFALNGTTVSSLGWDLSLMDDHFADTPEGLAAYWNASQSFNGIYNLQVIDNIMNNKEAVKSAIAGAVDVTYAEDGNGIRGFRSDCLMKNFKNAETVSNSFNGSMIVNPINLTVSDTQGYSYTYTSMLEENTKLTEVVSSFNFCVPRENAFIVDVFGGALPLIENYPDKWSNKITTIAQSFAVSGENEKIMNEKGEIVQVNYSHSFFVMTDDMFARFADKIRYLQPNQPVVTIEDQGTSQVTKVNYNANITESTVYGWMFGLNDKDTASSIIKTYVRFKNRTGLPTGSSVFPYGVLKGCTSLEGCPGLFANLDLRHWVDKTSLAGMGTPLTTAELEAGTLLTTKDAVVTLPDCYSSAPYAPVRKYGEMTYVHKADFSMFADCVWLTNITSMFRNITPPDIIGSAYSLGDQYVMPAAIKLTARSFEPFAKRLTSGRSQEEITKAVYAQCLFADNHFITGHIPFGLMSTGKTTERVYVQGFSAAAANNGSIGIDSGTSVLDSAPAVYVRDPYVLDRDAYVWDIKQDEFNTYTITDSETASKVATVDGRRIMPMVKFDPTNALHHRLPKYALKHLSVWQRSAATGTGLPSAQTQAVTVTVPFRVIASMTRIFKGCDARGFAYIHARYKQDEAADPAFVYENALGFAFNDATYNAENKMKIAAIKKYKETEYVADDYMKLPDGTWLNENMVIENESYNPFEFVSNPDYDTAEFTETGFSIGGYPVYEYNGSYDPRFTISNPNSHELIFNKYVYDGKALTDSEITAIGDQWAIYIGGDAISIVPDEWTNPHALSEDWTINLNWDSLSAEPVGIFAESSTEYETIGSNSEHQRQFNKLIWCGLHDTTRYFVPSDIFAYCRKNTNVNYAFAEGGWLKPRVTDAGLQSTIRDISEDPVDKSLRRIGSGEFYYEIDICGDMFSGFTGRVSPMMFDNLSGLSTIEGIFYQNPQLSPYTYPVKVDGTIEQGMLFDPDTFNGIVNLQDAYRLWSNNSIPRNVKVHQSTFRKTTRLQFMDYAFAGTLFFGYKADDDTYGGQIPYGMLSNQRAMQSVNAMFSTISGGNYAINHTSNAKISILSNSTTLENTGMFGVRSIPENLFSGSYNSLSFLQALFYYDKSLNHIPEFWNIPGSEGGHWQNPTSDAAVVSLSQQLWQTFYYLAGERTTPSENIDNAQALIVNYVTGIGTNPTMHADALATDESDIVRFGTYRTRRT